MLYLLVAVIGYALGNFTASYFVGKGMKNIDIRDHGSGNAGATNTYRVLGLRAGAIVFISDVLKGILAALIGLWIIGSPVGILVAGGLAVVGHNWPVVLDFKGGKGVASSFGVILVLSIELAVILLAFGLLLVLLTRYVSLASISCATLFPILLIVFSYPVEIIILGSLLALMAILRHRANISRLIIGNENKISFRRK